MSLHWADCPLHSTQYPMMSRRSCYQKSPSCLPAMTVLKVTKHHRHPHQHGSHTTSTCASSSSAGMTVLNSGADTRKNWTSCTIGNECPPVHATSAPVERVFSQWHQSKFILMGQNFFPHREEGRSFGPKDRSPKGREWGWGSWGGGSEPGFGKFEIWCNLRPQFTTMYTQL